MFKCRRFCLPTDLGYGVARLLRCFPFLFLLVGTSSVFAFLEWLCVLWDGGDAVPSSLGCCCNDGAEHPRLWEFPCLEFQGFIPGAAGVTQQIENAGSWFVGRREGDGELQHPAPQEPALKFN